MKKAVKGLLKLIGGIMVAAGAILVVARDRKSTRLNSSHQ